MRIYYSPYELKGGQRVRQGALLKVIDEEGMEGYADCHPWSELGDASLSEQLACLGRRELTPLTAQSLLFSRIDAALRKEKKNAFQGLQIPKSHYLIMSLSKEAFIESNEALAEGFTVFKIKLGKALHEETPLLIELLKQIPNARLDFNGACTEEQFCNFLKRVKPVLHKIDFIEDPFRFDESAWNRIQSAYSVKLACDRDSFQAIGKPYSAKVLVHKPAVEKKLSDAAQQIVVTSYLDHPFGQACAAFVAASYRSTMICGLNSHRVYEPNLYSTHLEWKSPVFRVPSGTGFGFDDLLEGEPWKRLI